MDPAFDTNPDTTGTLQFSLDQPAAMNATALTIRRTKGGHLKRGQYPSIGQRLHIITGLTTADPTDPDSGLAIAGAIGVTIRPWLRFDYPAGAAVEFARPVGMMRLKPDSVAMVERTTSPLSDLSLVLSDYVDDVVRPHPDAARIAKRIAQLTEWWGAKSLAQVTGATCRAYTASRGTPGGAWRDIQDLSAAIGHHHREGYHREIVKVALPKRGEARERWLSRDEIARLVWAMWRVREGGTGATKDGNTTVGRHTMRHLARFVLYAYATASRPGAVLTASWHAASGRSYLDLDAGVFYRLREGGRATNKRQPPVRLPGSILAHLRRWRRLSSPDASGFVVEWRGEPVARVKVGFATAVRLAKLGAGISPHTLQHSAITHMMQRGVSTYEAGGFAGMGEAVMRRHYAYHHPDHMGEAVAAMGGGGGRQKRYRLT